MCSEERKQFNLKQQPDKNKHFMNILFEIDFSFDVTVIIKLC